jgi:hypothetical protein
VTADMPLKIIKIPRAPKSAFKKDNEVSTLLQSQINHVAEAEQQMPANKRTGVDVRSIATEHDAAEYVGTVTKRLLPKARKAWVLPRGTRAPKSGVWMGPATLSAKKPTQKRTSTKTRKHR